MRLFKKVKAVFASGAAVTSCMYVCVLIHVKMITLTCLTGMSVLQYLNYSISAILM